jgi:DNA (cytosine-5)-methyltransferase 1
MPTEPLTLLDLFCGAGGLSLGFIRSGFSVTAAFDNNEVAVKSYCQNLGPHARVLDLANASDLPNATVIAGGPPCQGFSSAGMRRAGDHRNNLVSRFAKIIGRLKPKAFVFENVEGFLTTDDGAHVLELLIPLVETGYQIHVRKINAANYGVPQHRKRVIAIGGLGWEPSFPTPTHTAFGAPGALLATRNLPLTPTIRDVLEGLPFPQLSPPGNPQGHYYQPLEGLDLERAMALRPGETMRDLPDRLHHESYRRRANRRVMDGTPTEKRGGAPAGVRRLRNEEPSKAITGGACSEFLHPAEHRPLTIRECARLQTFPDDFTFFGGPSEQRQLIGNAVPPRLASLIATSVAEGLQNTRNTSTKGAVLSFVPTLSDGCSPALRHVITKVQRQFAPCMEKEELFLWP